MKLKLAVGLLLTFLAIVLVWPKTTETQALPKPNIQTSSPGRFQIFVNPNVRADTILLDTETGKTWVQTTISNVKGGPTVWFFREKIDDEKQFEAWSESKLPGIQ